MISKKNSLVMAWRSAAVVVVLLSAGNAFSVTDEEIFRDFRFNFINPGGRSLAMGGAFVSIANDATAAQANPAGLANLVYPQIFAEVRSRSIDDTATGQVFADPLLPFSFSSGTSTETVTNASFLSYVHPLGRLAFAASRQELLNVSTETLNSYEVGFADTFDTQAGRGSVDLELVNWNISMAWAVHDRVHLGATASVGTLDVKSNVLNTYVDPSGLIVPEFGGLPVTMFESSIEDSDTDVTWTGGVQWQIIERLGVAAAYRQGGDFMVEETIAVQPLSPTVRPGQIVSRLVFNETETLLAPDNTSFSFENRFHVPDVAAFGLHWEPFDDFTIALDAQRIKYSNLLDGYNSRLNVLTVGWETEEEASFTTDDQTNLHLGFEYVFRGGRARNDTAGKPQSRVGGVALMPRVGVHQEKDSRIRSDFAPGGFGLASNEIFPEGEDLTHYSLGLGISVGNQVQLDLAADASENSTEVVLSFIFKLQ